MAAQPTTLAPDTELTIEPRAPIPVGTTFNAAVSYEGQPSTSSVPGASLLTGWINYDTGIIAYGEPWGASHWFPVNEHPSDKSPVHLHHHGARAL